MTGQGRRNLIGYGFVLPWLIGLTFFIAWPFLSGLYFSFCDYPPLKGPMFIGSANYAELLTDVKFHQSLGVTMVFAAVAIPLGVILALTLALLLNARVRGQSFYRVIFYLPHLVPTVVVAILWLWIFNPDFGLFNLLLGKLTRAVDLLSGVGFDVQALAAGHIEPRWGLLLLLPILLAPVAALSGRFASLWRALHGLVKLLVIALVFLAALAVLNASLHWLAPDDMRKLRSPGWLSDGNPMPSKLARAPSWALWALIIMSLWAVGQMALIYLAKLQDVPVELYEAADIDGAGWLSKTRNITIPMISPVILFNVVMAIIGTFQIFAEPYIMTQGGPAGKTRFVAMFVYENAFQYQRLGYASAVAWVLFMVIVVLTLLAFWLLGKRVYYAGR